MQRSIGKRLIGSFLFIAILFGITSGIFYYFLSQINQSYLNVLNQTVVLQDYVKNIEFYVVQRNNNLNNYLLTLHQDYLSMLQQDSEKIDELLARSFELMENDEGKAKIQYLKELNQMFRQKVDRVVELSLKNMEAAKAEAVHSVIPFGKIMIDMSEEITIHLEKIVNLEKETNRKHVTATTSILISISAAVFIAAIWIGMAISRSISRPLESLAKAIEVIASGDITIDDVQTRSKDEIGRLVYGFNEMKNNLRELVQQLISSAEHVAAYSERLKASAEQTGKAAGSITEVIQQVAASSDKQLHHVEESVSSIHELPDQIQLFMNAAEITATLSVETAEKAIRGNHGIQSTKNQMNSIHASINQLAEMIVMMGQHSKEIEQIIEVISKLASQTNLLALNAAIEAARAGEHGRGFAVVADEIRKLAEQSTSSTGQIIQIIKNVQDMTRNVAESMHSGENEVAVGMQIAQTAGEMFLEIERSIQQVSQHIEEETYALQRLSAKIGMGVDDMQNVLRISEHVTTGMQHVSASTEEQLASMEEISCSAKQLADLADELQAVVGKFRI